MSTRNFVDTEGVVKEWLLNTAVAPLVTYGSYTHVYLAMPPGSPNPSIILSRVGGGPEAGSDVPVDFARVSCACWGKNRMQAMEISKTLVSEAESFGETGGYTTDEAILQVGEVLSWLWLPDPVSDTARYIVDVRFAVTAL